MGSNPRKYCNAVVTQCYKDNYIFIYIFYFTSFAASSKAKVSVRPTKPKDPPHLIEFQVSLSSRQALHSFLHDSNTPTEFSLCHLASLLYSLLGSDYVNLYILNPEPLSIQESLVFNVTSRTPRQWRVLEDDIYITQAARERRTLVHVAPCQDCKCGIFVKL